MLRFQLGNLFHSSCQPPIANYSRQSTIVREKKQQVTAASCPIKAPEEDDEEEMEEANETLTLRPVISELDGIFPFKEYQNTALFLGGQHVSPLLPTGFRESLVKRHSAIAASQEAVACRPSHR